MPISFNQIPNTIRVPFVTAEFDNTRASQGPELLPYRCLIIGQKTSAGEASGNSLHQVTNVDDVIRLAGRGSMLHRQALAHFKNNTSTETWIGVLADNGAGVAATGLVSLSGTVTAAGTLNLYLGGTAVQIGVAAGASMETIGAAIEDAVNENLDLIVTATQGGEGSENEITITHRHKGVVGNSFDIRVNYQTGEVLPEGLAVAVTPMASGATNPTLTSLIAALGDNWYQVITMPYTDATSLTAMEDELESRFGPMRMIDGVCFTASNESVANLGTLGNGRNSQHVSIIATNQSPTPIEEYAAAAAAVAAFYGNIDPARPFQTLKLTGVKAPSESAQFTFDERNILLFDGISTTKVAPGGVVQLERLITTYKTSASGAADTSYLDVTTMLTLLYLRFTFRNRIMQRFPRHKLANDGTNFGAGQAVITPKLGKAEAITWFREMESLGLVENFAQFKTDLIVERNAQDVNRLDFRLPPDIINQFIVGAAQIQFRL